MDELINHVSAAAGLEPEVSRKALALILAFLQREGPPEAVGRLMDALPGAREAASASATEEEAQGDALGDAGGVPAGGGLMGLAGQLAGIGLGFGEMQAIGQELFKRARERVGEDTLRTIAGAIPGLAPFV